MSSSSSESSGRGSGLSSDSDSSDSSSGGGNRPGFLFGNVDNKLRAKAAYLDKASGPCAVQLVFLAYQCSCSNTALAHLNDARD